MITEPSLPQSSFLCTENIPCSLTIGQYVTNYDCTFVYEILDSGSNTVLNAPSIAVNNNLNKSQEIILSMRALN